MQRLLEKSGFKYCGIILLEDNSERIAFEKIIYKLSMGKLCNIKVGNLGKRMFVVKYVTLL